VIAPDKLLWVVVGDAAKVRPQLDALNLPVETLAADFVVRVKQASPGE
jgi:hypothetical protein